MSIIDTLITNRTQADVDALRALYAKPKSMWTADEWNEFLLGNHRGAYNASDMNRVLDALDYLADRVTQFGYRKPEIKRPSITEVIPGTERWDDFTQPVLTADGTLGGTKFAVGASNITVGYEAWRAFSKDASIVYSSAVNPATTNVTYTIYNPDKLKITKLTFTNVPTPLTSSSPKDFTISGSDDGAFWTALGSYTNTNNTNASSWSITVNPGNGYKYYRILMTSANTTQAYVNIGKIQIEAQVLNPNPGRMPYGYTELEYIRSTGEQYVNTLFIPNQNSKISAIIKSDSGSFSYVYGSFNVGSTGMFAAMSTRVFYGANSTAISGVPSGKISISQNKNEYDIGGVAGSFSASEFSSNFPLYLFAVNNAGTVSAGKFTGAVYCFKIYDNGTLVRDYIPCLNHSNEVGLYDIVNGVFYGNAGTGEFVPGFKLDENTLFYMNGSYLYDSSSNGMAVTNNGTSVSEARSKFGGKSLYFDGTSYLTANVPVTGDVTLDCWVYQISFASDFPTPFNHLDGSYRGYYVHLTESKVYCDATNASGGMQSAQLASMPLGEWHHIAVTRSGTTVKFYVDGVLAATITNAHTANDVLWLGIMPSAESLTPFNGYIDELRVSNMVRWTENFTPPTESYLFQGIIPSQTVIRDYYKIGDRPPASELAEYLANVARIRAVLELPVSIPAAPEDISQRITIEDANNIEFILTAVETLLNRISLSWIYSGEAYSGEV